MTEPTTLLGPFQLLERVARGSVGEVWRAVHVRTHVPAAVKLLSADAARDPLVRMALRAELRAVAALNHPNIVYVFGTGEISSAVARRSRPELSAGSAWMAMEFADGGSIRASAGRMTWPAVRAALLDVLAGLAHAHARGFVHGDIKPANLLVGGVRPGVKIADFGLAHRFDADPRGRAGREPGWGSPSYMAPEQIDPTVGAVGPCSDLYALGATAWALLTGFPPFTGEPIDVLERQLSAPLPQLLATCAIPEGVEPWLRRLLTKEPSRRVQTAADASRRLLAIAEEVAGSRRPAPRGPAAPGERTQPVSPLSGRPLAEADARAAEHSRPAPFPPRPVSQRALPPMFAGTGLELLGLRSLEVVGRDPEQEFLWSRLREVVEAGTARVVVVRGPSGVGTSRLVRWLSETAAEAGVARTMVAWYGTGSGPARGLRPAFARAFRLGAAGEDSVDTLEQRAPGLDPADRAALAAWISAAGRRGSPLVPRAELLALWRRSLAALVHATPPAGEGLPLILWLDGAHHGSVEALALARSLAGAEVPVLVAVTVTDELLAPASLEAGLLAGLRELQRVEELRLTPLGEAACRDLLETQLGLERPFADAVALRTRGNPLFALQLVGDCVQRGILESGARGVRLQRGAAVSLPEDLERVWARRFEGAAGGLAAEAATSVELLAVLGDPADHREWAEACSDAGFEPSAGLTERLEAEGLLARSEGGAWRFVHAMFREALERRAARGGRLDDHHRACAGMLRRQRDRALAERVGRHLLAAGDLGGSLAPLAEAIEDKILARETQIAAELLELREGALTRSGVGPDDARRAVQRLLEALLCQMENDLEGAESRVRSLLDDAARLGWVGVQARGLWLRGRVARRRGDLTRAREALSDAAMVASAVGDPRTVARARADLGDVLVDLGEWAAARQCFANAAPLFEQLDDAFGAGEVAMGLALLDIKSGAPAEAEVHARAARLRFERLGSRVGLARAANLLGDLARFQGEPDRAADEYREAARLLEAVSSWMAFVPQVNLGLLLVETGAFAAAKQHLLDQAALVELYPTPEVDTVLRLGLLITALALGDPPLAARSMERLDTLLTPVRRRDPEMRGLLERAEAQALAANEGAVVAWVRTRLSEAQG